MSVNNRNVTNKDKWTRLSLELVIKTPSIYVKLLRHYKAAGIWLTCFLLTNQTSISIIMLTNIHIWICLVFKKSQGLPVNAVKYSHLQNNNYWFVNRVDTRSNDTVLNSVGLMILNNSNFKFANNALLFSKLDWTQEIQRKVTFLFAKRMSFILKSFIDEQ